ncbi:MAG: hypothetical protein KDC92_06765 [Bacteroidetes bacterium]|nr:hypothetical protein [Bacteroidota bacterium]
MKTTCKAVGILSSFVFLFALSFQFQSCGLFSNDPPDIDTFYLDQEFLAYTYTPKGHYWIFREMSTGETDSTYMVNWHPNGDEDIEFEQPGSFFMHRVELRSGKLMLRGKLRSCKWYLGDHAFTQDVEYDQSLYGLGREENSSTYIMVWKYHSEEWNNPGHDISFDDYFTTQLDTLSIAGVLYKNPVEVILGVGWESVPFVYRTIFAKNIGPIFREFYDGTRWELIRHGQYPT